MRKLLLITTALVGFAAVPDRAEAAPVVAAIAGSLGFAAGTVGFAVVQGVVTAALSFGLSALQAKMRGKPKAETVRAELTRATSLPAYRFVYGKTWAPGTPVAWLVKGKYLYICYLLNSRPSAGPFTVLFDKRAVEKTGNEYDFGPEGGAIATNSPFNGTVITENWYPDAMVRYWIGRGDQTTCPATIVAETGGYFTAADAWRGRTVLWARLHCGKSEDMRERWPSTPPELNVDGQWSIVRDPRDGQDKFSRNQGLIVLDALRNNPLRPYGDVYLDLPSFAAAADAAAQAVPVKGGGTIPRYHADGVLVFGDGSEIEDQIEPLLAAGASRLTRNGGKLAIVPGVARPAIKTISDFTTGQPVDLVRWRSSDELYTEATARFMAPDRAYESAETPVFVVPGAQAADGGTPKRLVLDLDFVVDYRQAERLAKIAALKSRMQRQISGELFPDCFDLVGGSIGQVALPWPYEPWAGLYEVERIEPAAGLNDDQSVTVRLPVVLSETSNAIWEWDAATDEKDMRPGNFNAQRGKVQPPPRPTLTTGSPAAQQSGDAVVPAVVGAWPASASASATGYAWEWMRGQYDENTLQLRGTWVGGGVLSESAAEGGSVFIASIPWVDVGKQYRIRVQTIGAHGRSDWVVSDWIMATGPAASVAAPPAPSAAPGPGRVNLTLRQANDRNARELLLFVATVNNPLASNQIGVPFEAGASVSISTSETGLTAGIARYYWTRARDQWGNLSDFSAGANATPT